MTRPATNNAKSKKPSETRVGLPNYAVLTVKVPGCRRSGQPMQPMGR